METLDTPTATTRWNVYTADNIHVATYDNEQAAKAHTQCWPAAYYKQGT